MATRRPPAVRPYHSPARLQQANATRDAIAHAARRLFSRDGYRGTTVRTIAEEAGVAQQTVYGVFKSKRGILMELVRRAKHQADVGLAYTQLMAEVDPRRQLALSVDITVRWAKASVDLVDLVRAEADSDKDVADAWHSAENSRYRGNRSVIHSISERGYLREDLSVDDATDLLWSMESTDFYRLLVRERGWSTRRYGQVLTELLCRSVLRRAED